MFELVEGPFSFSWGWAIELLGVLSFALLATLIQKRLLTRLFKKGPGNWRKVAFEAAGAPLTLLIWAMSLAFSMELLQEKIPSLFFSFSSSLKTMGVVVAIAWFALRLVSRSMALLHERGTNKTHGLDRTTIDALSKVAKVCILVVAALVGLQSLGMSISGILAFGGIGGIAIGFAAKDLLANFFGAFMLYWDRPFQVGDWIRSPDREIEGTVESIGWRLTRIRTFDKRPLYVPNSLFASITVENPSRMSNRRIHETIGLRYQDAQQVAAVLAEIRQMLQTHEEIDQNQTLMVHLNQFGPSSLDFFIYTFTKTTVWTRFHEIKEEILLRVHDIIEKNGAEVAFPTSTVHLESLPGPLPDSLLKVGLKPV